MSAGSPILAEARVDSTGCLVAADEPLAGLQLRCGGTIPDWQLYLPQLHPEGNEPQNRGRADLRHISRRLRG